MSKASMTWPGRLITLFWTLIALYLAWFAYSQADPLIFWIGLAEYDLLIRLCLVFLSLSLLEKALHILPKRASNPDA